MNTHQFINEIEPGDRIVGFYCIKEVKICKTKNGDDYLSAILADKTGCISAVMWKCASDAASLEAGKVVYLDAESKVFREKKQLTLKEIRNATPEERSEYRENDMIAMAPINISATIAYVLEQIHAIEDPDFQKICLTMYERHREELISIPAAKSVHHSFVGGLLMHTANMLRLTEAVIRVYKNVVNPSLLTAGVFLHDIGKIKEFEIGKLGTVTAYTAQGNLLGHPVMGADEVKKVAEELGVSEEKSMLLQHMILGHHGKPEHGAAVKPLCVECEVLSNIDMVDSRVEIYAESLEKMTPGTFSGPIFGLEKSIYKHLLS